MDVAPPSEALVHNRAPRPSLRDSWSRWEPLARTDHASGGMAPANYVTVAALSLAATGLILLCRLVGLHDLGSGGSWLAMQFLPGLAICVWVSGLRPSTMLLYSWVGSATVVTWVGMSMALTGLWSAMAALVVVCGASVISIALFLLRRRHLGLHLAPTSRWRSREALLTHWLAVLGLLICAVSSPSNPSGPGRAGLIALISPTWFVGLACILIAFVAAVVLRVRPWVSVIAASVVVMISQALVYGLPTMVTAARHVGVINYVMHYQRVVPGDDIYLAWSGMFTGQAWLLDASGVESTFTVATWWPVLGMAFEVIAVRVLAGRFIPANRAWIAGGVFGLANVLNTVYYAPQVLAFAPALAILTLLIAPVGSETARMRQLRVAATIPIGIAVVVIHQISPFIVFSALAVLVLARAIRPWWTPFLILVPAVAWTLINAGTLKRYVSSSTVGNLLANLAPPSHPPTAFPEPLIAVLTFNMPAAALLCIGIAALLALYRNRDRTALLLAVLAVSPLGLSLLTNYGGEGIFRITLFALPWLTILAFYQSPARRGRRGRRRQPSIRWRTAAGAGVAATALMAVSFLGQTGMDWVRIIRPGALVAERHFEQVAPKGAYLLNVGSDNATPVQQTYRYLEFVYTSREGMAPEGDSGYPKVTGPAYDPVADVRAVTERFRKIKAPKHYALVSEEIGAYGERYGSQKYSDYLRMETAFAASPSWKLVKKTPDASLYMLADGS